MTAVADVAPKQLHLGGIKALVFRSGRKPQAALGDLYARGLHVHANESCKLGCHGAREPRVEADVHADIEHEAVRSFVGALLPAMNGGDESSDRQRLDQIHVADTPRPRGDERFQPIASQLRLPFIQTGAAGKTWRAAIGESPVLRCARFPVAEARWLGERKRRRVQL